MGVKSKITVRQLHVNGFDDNFSYLMYGDNGDAAIVDPCGDIAVIRVAIETAPVQLRPKYILITHAHRDHISALDAVLDIFPAQVVAHSKNTVSKDISPANHQILPFAGSGIECLYTPGHTADSICYRLVDDSAIFTGDTLFIDWCGFCDAETMFKTMREVLFPLADSLVVWSGHDYGHVPFATLGEEKKSNVYLNTTDFNEFKRELKKL